MEKLDRLKKSILSSMDNIEEFRKNHPESEVEPYNSGRYDAYYIVLMWIDQLWKEGDI